MSDYLTTGTAIDLDVDLIREIKDVHTTAHRRAWAAGELVADIERQLSDEEREQLENEHNETEGNND